MTARSADEVRTLILACLDQSIASWGIVPADIPDAFDLRAEGVIDSLGFMQLVVQLEEHLGMPIEFDGLDPDNLTILGPLSRYIAERYLS